MQRAVLDNLTTTAPKDVKGGAFEVEVDVREVFQAQAGTSNIKAFASTGERVGGSYPEYVMRYRMKRRTLKVSVPLTPTNNL